MRRLVAGLGAATVLVAGCAVDGLEFTNDRRVEWVTEDRAIVALPFTLSWTLDGFDMVGPDGSADPDAGYVAIFVDRSPQRPFEPLEALAHDDEQCELDPTCPDTEWLLARGVHVVEAGTSVTIDQLPGRVQQGRREVRNITLVLLDGQGRRQGESAFRLRVEIDRTPSAS